MVDQTVDKLVNAASAAFGGVDNDTSERVHALVNLNQTLAQKEASIRRLIKFDVGKGRKLRGEIDNLLGAHAWCDHAADGGPLGLRLVRGVRFYLFNRGRLALALRMTLEALARPGASARDFNRCRAC